jgi:hypothetical protein
VPYPRRNRLLLSNRFSYLLHATFSGATAAPLPASLSVDVGGPLTINDTSGDFLYVTGGRLVTSGFTGAGDPRAMYAAGFARIAGRALLFTFRGTLLTGGNNARHSLGWYTSATPTSQPYYGPGDVAGVAGMYIDGSGAVASLFADNTDYDVALILRGTGAFLLSRPTASGGAYTLQYVSATGSQATMYPGMTSRATENRVQIDNLRVADLAAIDGRFAAYALATNRHLTPAAATTTASTADAVIEFTFTFATALSEIHVRRTDASNHWIVRVTATGFLQLIENNAGSQTVRGSLGGLYSGTSTYRVVVVQSGTTITCYSSDVMRFTYASAVLNATATEVRIHAVGSAISELICWPRNVTLAGGV